MAEQRPEADSVAEEGIRRRIDRYLAEGRPDKVAALTAHLSKRKAARLKRWDDRVKVKGPHGAGR